MNDTFHISRAVLERVFDGDVRSARQFEELQRQVSETAAATSAGVEATGALKDAAFITLSPNAELPNERVLELGEGLRFAITDDDITILSDAPRISGGHNTTFTVTGDTNLALPLNGVVATREWLASLNLVAVPGPFANDAAAATGGVAVGEIYLKATKLATRMV